MRKMRTTFGGIKTIWIMFAVFLILFGVNNMSTDAISAVTSRAWLLVMLWSFILSIMLLIKNRLPFKTSIAIAGIFGGLVLVSYAEVWKTANTGRAIYIIAVAISTFLASMAVFGVFEKQRNCRMVLLKKEHRCSVLWSVLLGILVGAVWGLLNYLLMRGSNEADLRITFSCLLAALNPAIHEEMTYRALFYAFCVGFCSEEKQGKFAEFTCWFMMVVPHVLVHTPDAFISGGIISGLVSTILYVLLFGLPFAVLQRKRDIVSAMTAHGTVVLIRFCIFGLPY